MLPLSYALRNLFRDKSRLVQTVGGSALVVLLIMAATALNSGMAQVLSASGSPRNAILLGAGSEESIQRSEVSAQLGGIAEAGIPGVSTSPRRPQSPRKSTICPFSKLPGGGKGQGLFRGVTPKALLVHPEVRIIEGAFPRAGEVMVGKLAWRKLGLPEESLQPGKKVMLDGSEMTVSGIFRRAGNRDGIGNLDGAGRSLHACPARYRLLCRPPYGNARGFFRSGSLRQQRLDLELAALRETDYYAALSSFYKPLRIMTWITAGLVAAGAVFGGFNTLYAAFASRIRELATLQAIGFGRVAVFFSLVQESVIACLGGTLVASVAALALLDGLTIPFSIGAFTITISPQVAVTGLVTGVLLGILGSIPPAIRCLRPSLPRALRS